MKKQFILFRHGQTDYNLEQRLHGCLDITLNDTGREQAEALTEKLREYGVEIIFSSHLSRAVETAKIAAEPLDIPVEICDTFAEANLGDAEGMLWEDINKKYQDICATLFKPNVRMSDRFPNGESKEEITDRMFAAMMSLIDLPYSVIGISSHGVIISRFLQALGRGDAPLPNGEIILVEFENGKFYWKQ